LQNDLQNQANTRRASIDTNSQNLQQQGSQLVNDIGGTYQGAQNQLGQLFQQLGIQQAAPQLASLGSDQAYRQAQAQANTQSQINYGRNRDTNQANWLSNMGNAAQAQGASSRNDLLNQLATAFANIEGKRSALGAQQTADINSTAASLAQAASQSKQNAFANLSKLYEYTKGKETTAFQQALDEWKAKYGSGTTPPPVTDDSTQLTKMINSGMNDKLAQEAMNVAGATAQGGGLAGNAAMKDVPTFVNYVVTQMQTKHPNDRAAADAAREAAFYFADKMKFQPTSNTG
jgi:hypothetical protein